MNNNKLQKKITKKKGLFKRIEFNVGSISFDLTKVKPNTKKVLTRTQNKFGWVQFDLIKSTQE